MKMLLNLMSSLTTNFLNLDIFYTNATIPKLSVGDKVRITIYLELPKKSGQSPNNEKERLQVFEGILISKHLAFNKVDATITIRKMFQGGGIEKVFLVNSPWIKNIKLMGRSIVKRSKLYYLRERTGKSARLKNRLRN